MSSTVPPSPVSGVMQNGTGVVTGASNMNPSLVNSLGISTVINKLSIHAYGTVREDASEFVSLCLSLSRGIDFSIANQEVAIRAQELPSLLRKVYQRNKHDHRLQSTIMVLMISVKNACQCGWFSDNDCRELKNVFQEIASIFCSVTDFNTDSSSSVSVISTVMARFLPRLKMGQIFVFLEAKPGFEAYVSDFQITKNLRSTPGDKIRLFVVQTDNIETSSCLIAPPKVSFLLNGVGVDLRTSVSLDTGPQVPTVVKHLVKYGSNLLQAVGDFNGKYIIAVALMTDVSSPDGCILQDYEQQASAVVDSDAEIIEGPSRISLNCPISKKRLRTPVKGFSCKHIQCFDFDNYIDINSRRPSWRCAHCNQPVCFTDIRIDQNMAKILKEVGPQVTEIVLSSDGSWNTPIEIENDTKDLEDKNSNSVENSPKQVQDFSATHAPFEESMLDLTETTEFMDDIFTHEPQERKFNPKLDLTNPHAASTSNDNQTGPQTEDESRSRILFSTLGSELSSEQPHAESNNPPSPSLLDSIISAPHEIFNGNSLVTSTSVPLNKVSAPNILQQQRNVTGVPDITPIQNSLLQQQRTIYQANTSFVQGNSSAGSHASVVSPRIINFASHVTSNQVSPHMSSSPVNTPWLQPHQQATSILNRNSHERQQMVINRMPPHLMSQSQVNTIRLPSQQASPSPAGSFWHHPQSYVHPVVTAGNQHSQVGVANRGAQMFVDGSHSYVHVGVTPQQPLPRIDPEPNSNWRPDGRMRGSLTGQEYTNALNQFIRPNQQVQVQSATQIQSPPNLTSSGPLSRPIGTLILHFGEKKITSLIPDSN